MKKFSDALLEALTEHNMNICSLSRATNISTSVIWEYCNDIKIPKADKFISICNCLAIDPFDIYFERKRK